MKNASTAATSSTTASPTVTPGPGSPAADGPQRDQRVQRRGDEDAQRVLDHQVAAEAQHQPRAVLAGAELDHHHRDRHHQAGEGDHAARDRVQDLARVVGVQVQAERIGRAVALQLGHDLAQRDGGHDVDRGHHQPAAVEPFAHAEAHPHPRAAVATSVCAPRSLIARILRCPDGADPGRRAADPRRLEAIRRDTAELVRTTPVLTSRSLSERCGGVIALKAENLQRTGSFKLRGALSKVRTLGGDTAGVVAGSAGNHAQALAYAARSHGIPLRGLRARGRSRGQGGRRALLRRDRAPGRRGRGRLRGQRPRGGRRTRPDVREPLRRLRRDRRPGRRGPGARGDRARPGARGGARRRRRAGRRPGHRGAQRPARGRGRGRARRPARPDDRRRHRGQAAAAGSPARCWTSG